ncbi:hypothetical protein Tco_1292808 [Tanacetum coccineum]
MGEIEKPKKYKSVEKTNNEASGSELKLDICDPLYRHPQDIGSQLSTFMLEGTKNYKVRYAVVHLALLTRNKSGFITGDCVRSPNNGVYKDQWDIAPKIKKHAQLLRLMKFLIGLDDVFSSMRSLILTTNPIHDVKFAFATLSRDEFHRNSHASSKGVMSCFGSDKHFNDGGDNAVNGNKTAPDNNTQSPRVSTVDETSRDKEKVHSDTVEQLLYDVSILLLVGRALGIMSFQLK